MAKQVKKILLRNVRISFANIYEPKGFNGGAPRYSASFLISKDDKENLEIIREAMKFVSVSEWKNDAPKFKENQLCLRDGDNETWDGYADHMFVSSGNSEQFPPVLRSLDGTNLRHSNDETIESGDYVNVSLNIWAQNNNYGKRINASLMGVQFVKTGARFGGSDDSDMFGETTVKQNDDPFAPPPKLKFGSRAFNTSTDDEIDKIF